MRAEQKRDQPKLEPSNRLNEVPNVATHEARSERSSKSVNASNGFGKTIDQANKSKYLVYEDPAA